MLDEYALEGLDLLEISVLGNNVQQMARSFLLRGRMQDRNYLILDAYWTLMKIQYSLF
jgi:hypothetical protein